MNIGIDTRNFLSLIGAGATVVKNIYSEGTYIGDSIRRIK